MAESALTTRTTTRGSCAVQYNTWRMSFISYLRFYSSRSTVYLPAIPTKRHGNCSRLRELQRHVLCCLACSGRHPSCRKRTTKRKTIREGKSDYVWPDTCNATVNKGWQFAVLTPQSCTNKQISHPSDGFKRLGGSGLQLYLYMDSHVRGSDVLKKWTNTSS